MHERHINDLPKKIKLEIEDEIETEQEIEWRECKEEIRELKEKIYSKAREQSKDKGAIWAYVTESAFAKKLKTIYPDYNKYIAYHELIGSNGIIHTQAPKLDFPEPDSVKTFYEETLKKLDEIEIT